MKGPHGCEELPVLSNSVTDATRLGSAEQGDGHVLAVNVTQLGSLG